MKQLGSMLIFNRVYFFVFVYIYIVPLCNIKKTPIISLLGFHISLGITEQEGTLRKRSNILEAAILPHANYNTRSLHVLLIVSSATRGPGL